MWILRRKTKPEPTVSEILRTVAEAADMFTAAWELAGKGYEPKTPPQFTAEDENWLAEMGISLC